MNEYVSFLLGFLTEEEARLLDKHKEESDQQVAWVPIVWACQIVQRAGQAGRIATNLGQKSLTDEMLNLRVSCGRLLGFNSHNIPLVYVQVGLSADMTIKNILQCFRGSAHVILQYSFY